MSERIRQLQSDFFAPLFTAGADAAPTPVSAAPVSPEPVTVEPAQPPAELPQSAASPVPEADEPIPTIEELRDLARRLLCEAGASPLADRMVLRWNTRLRNTAGMAFPGRALITLNPRLADFGPGEIDRTLRHELAHLLAQDRVGRRRIDPHGKEWKAACRDLGLPDEKRTHDLPLPRKTIAPRHFYQCPSCGFQLNRVHPLKRASACLQCCRTHSGGRYDIRFRFVKVAPPATNQ